MWWVCVDVGVAVGGVVVVRARRASGAGRATLLRGPCGLPCGARAGRGLAKLGYASNNASPDPPGPALLSHAQGIAQPAPLARLGIGYSGWESTARFHVAGVVAIFMGADYAYSTRARGQLHSEAFRGIPQSSAICATFGPRAKWIYLATYKAGNAIGYGGYPRTRHGRLD